MTATVTTLRATDAPPAQPDPHEVPAWADHSDPTVRAVLLLCWRRAAGDLPDWTAHQILRAMLPTVAEAQLAGAAQVIVDDIDRAECLDTAGADALTDDDLNNDDDLDPIRRGSYHADELADELRDQHRQWAVSNACMLVSLHLAQARP